MAAYFSYLSYLNVSLRSNSDVGLIYANGRNQVQVMVNFIALDDKGEQVFLDYDQMMTSLSLCDYYSRAPIANGWVATENYGDFLSDGILLDHASSYTAIAKEQKKEPLSALKSGLDGYLLPQSYCFWVSAENNVTTAKSFAVAMSDNAGTTYDTAINGNFESFIRLEPIAEKSYVMDDMFLSPDAYIEYNSDGTFQKRSNFFSFKNPKLLIKKVEGMTEDVDPYYETLICSSFSLWNATLRYAYLDGYRSGNNLYIYTADGQKHTYSRNERKGYLCFSLVDLENQSEVPVTHNPVDITVYDQYGNKGHFNVDVNSPSAEVMKIVIKDV